MSDRLWSFDAPGEPDPDDHATVREVVEMLAEHGFTIEFELDHPVPWTSMPVTLVHVESGQRWARFGHGKTGASAAVDALDRFARLVMVLRGPVVRTRRLRAVDDPQVARTDG